MNTPNPLPPPELQPAVAAASAKGAEAASLLDRYGIVTVMNASYEFGGYRYSNASDAIAAAKRANA